MRTLFSLVPGTALLGLGFLVDSFWLQTAGVALLAIVLLGRAMLNGW